MLLKFVPAAKSFVFVFRAAPEGKRSFAPAVGATSPTQLSGDVQRLSSASPPSHVKVGMFTAVTVRMTPELT